MNAAKARQVIVVNAAKARQVIVVSAVKARQVIVVNAVKDHLNDVKVVDRRDAPNDLIE